MFSKGWLFFENGFVGNYFYLAFRFTSCGSPGRGSKKSLLTLCKLGIGSEAEQSGFLLLPELSWGRFQNRYISMPYIDRWIWRANRNCNMNPTQVKNVRATRTILILKKIFLIWIVAYFVFEIIAYCMEDFQGCFCCGQNFDRRQMVMVGHCLFQWKVAWGNEPAKSKLMTTYDFFGYKTSLAEAKESHHIIGVHVQNRKCKYVVYVLILASKHDYSDTTFCADHQIFFFHFS